MNIDDSISELQKVIDSSVEYGTPDFSSRMSLRSLFLRMRELRLEKDPRYQSLGADHEMAQALSVKAAELVRKAARLFCDAAEAESAALAAFDAPDFPKTHAVLTTSVEAILFKAKVCAAITKNS